MLIICEECKKEVSNTIKNCPHCGAKIAKKTTFLGKVVYFLVSLVALIFVIDLISPAKTLKPTQAEQISAPTVQTSAPEQQASAEPAIEQREQEVQTGLEITVSSINLAKEYEKNEAKGDALYKDKTLVVKGMVTGIDKDFLDNTIINLKGINMFLGVRAEIDKNEEPKVQALKKGQVITVKCMGKGEIIGSPSLGDCIIQKKAK